MDIATMQSLIGNSFNTKPGSPIYSILLKPLETICAGIDTSVPSDIIYTTLEGTPAYGELSIYLDSIQPIYYFEKGTLFTTDLDITLESTEEVLIQGTSGKIPVKTTTNTNITIPLNYTVTASKYGELVLSCIVSGVVGGGTLDSKILKIHESTNTVEGFKTAILKSVPVLDVKPIGTYLLIKSNYREQEVTINSNTISIKKNILAFTSLPGKIITHEILYPQQAKEEHIITFKNTVKGTIKYLELYQLQDVQNWIDSNQFIFVINIRLATPSLITIPNATTEIKQYINALPIGSFSLGDMVKTLNCDIPPEISYTQISNGAYYII